MSYPDKQTVLDFLKEHPEATTKRDIARGLKVKGRERQILREILKDLEASGTLERTGKRAWAQPDAPPPTGVILFHTIDEHGDLYGQMYGKDGPFGPEIRYAGVSGKARKKEPGKGDRALCKIGHTAEGYHARLIKTLPKNEGTALVGIYEETNRGGRVEPASRKDKRFFLINQSDRNGAQDGDLVKAEPKAGGKEGPRKGVIVEVLGRLSDPRAASLLAIAAHDIPVEFPDAVIKQAQSATPAKCNRVDLTETPLITIDPHDARDHDDAVFAEQLEDGWKVIVAIADVAAYVTPGSALDKEAYKRGNSTYFPDRVVPMLPFELSAGECSLKEGEPRNCLAVEMVFDKSGTKRSHKFLRAKMRSAAALSYEDAQAAIDGRPEGRAAELLDDVLKPLWGAYAALKKAREKRAPLELELPERRIMFDEDGNITGIKTKERFDAHKLIEEMMIQANVAAAETLEKKKSPLLYRVHDAPSDAKIAALADFLGTLNIKWPKGERPQPGRFNALLGDHRGGDNAEVISQIVLRTQSQAVYDPENIGHFGLNLRKYAHFTSPIRRYADLIVHRALISSLGFGSDGLADSTGVRLEEIAEHIVMTERRSMAAERDASDRYLALFLEDRVGAEFEGRITGVAGAGLFVRLGETGADGFVPIGQISDDFWRFDDKAMALVTRNGRARYELGQIVSVKLAEADTLTGGLLLQMLSNPKRGAPSVRRSGGNDTAGRTRSNSPKGKLQGGGKARKKAKKSTLPKHKRKAKAKARRS